jgi:predicted O-methyltransferase YrrM
MSKLKIGVIGCDSYYGNGASYEKGQVAASLTAMGHDVHFAAIQIHTPCTARILGELKAFQPDMCLLIPHQDEVDPVALRSLNVPIVLLLCDDTWRREFGLQMAAYCDYVLGNAPDSVAAYGAKSVPFEWAVYAPLWTGGRVRPRDMDIQYDVAFVAQKYGRRQQIIEALQSSGLRVLVRGMGFPGGSAPVEEMAALMRQSKIGLNLSRTSQGNLLQIKIRPFETGATGAMILTEYAPGIEKSFVEDIEAVFFRTDEEMIDKALYYASHDAERLAIAQAGQARVLRDHVLERRWTVLLEHMSLAQAARTHYADDHMIGDRITGNTIQPLRLNIEGWLDPHETGLLHDLAAQTPAGGTIVEIGSYRGKSTVALALGAKKAGATVWAIDSHDFYEEGDTHYGAADNAAFMSTIVKAGLGETVRTINLRAEAVARIWETPIDLLFIDGSHEYEDVSRDFYTWAAKVPTGLIAMHDTSGNWPGVSRFVDELLAAGVWEKIAMADATSVFRRTATLQKANP